MDAQLEALIKFFEEIDRKRIYEGSYAKGTKVGLFYPSNLAKVNAGIEQLTAEGIINPFGWFMDAGGADGRVAALTKRRGIPSIYVEDDEELVNNAMGNFQELSELGIFDGVGAPLLVVKGYFSIPRFVHRENARELIREDETYLRLGIRFEDIATIFNFISNDESIAYKISRQSPKGTIFLLFKRGGAPKYEGLTFVKTVDLSHIDEYLGELAGNFLHVYRKI